MDEREQLQREVLQELITYSDSLIPAVQTIIGELRNEGFEDTNTFLNDVINGINWEIEVYNHCASLLNEKSSYIDKKAMITAVRNLGMSLNSGNRVFVADCLESDFLPFLNKLDLAAKLVV
ncbi:MAG: hypothetical protein K2K56_09030 [Lachnospiraceae bacterium]|nr:hypothetical protein [Lachnospiraceae bacterium]MDE6626498.1 hypothetical protein [Lachnospiraceae bacterium]